MELSNEWIFKKEFLEDVNSPRFNHVTDIRKEKEYRFKTIWFMKDLSNSLRYVFRYYTKCSNETLIRSLYGGW